MGKGYFSKSTYSDVGPEHKICWGERRGELNKGVKLILMGFQEFTLVVAE